MRFERKEIASVPQAEYDFAVPLCDDGCFYEGYRCVDGALKPAFRLAAGQLNLPTGVTAVRFYGSEPTLFASDGAVYRFDGLTPSRWVLPLEGVPVGCVVPYEGKRAYAFTDGEKSCLLCEDGVLEAAFAPSDYLAFAGELLFSGKGGRVSFSSLYGERAGFLDLPKEVGDLRAMVAFGGDVFVFCGQAAFCISPYGVPTEFVLKRLPVALPPFVCAPIAAENGVWAAAQDGLYCLKEGTLSRAAYPSGFSPAGDLTVAADGLLLRGKAGGRDAVCRYEFGGRAFSLLFGTYRFLSDAFGGSLFRDGVRYDVPTEQRNFFTRPVEVAFRSAETNLGKKGVKRLVRVTAEAGEPLTLVVRSERGQAVYALKEGRNEVFPTLRGERFTFSVRARGEGVLRGLTATYRI